MRKRAYIERAATRVPAKAHCGRGASAKLHGRRPYYCNARPFNSCTTETLSNGLLRLCRVVILFTSYCRSILLQHKPEKAFKHLVLRPILSDLVFCRQRDKCAQLVPTTAPPTTVKHDLSIRALQTRFQRKVNEEWTNPSDR